MSSERVTNVDQSAKIQGAKEDTTSQESTDIRLSASILEAQIMEKSCNNFLEIVDFKIEPCLPTKEEIITITLDGAGDHEEVPMSTSNEHEHPVAHDTSGKTGDQEEVPMSTSDETEHPMAHGTSTKHEQINGQHESTSSIESQQQATAAIWQPELVAAVGGEHEQVSTHHDPCLNDGVEPEGTAPLDILIPKEDQGIEVNFFLFNLILGAVQPNLNNAQPGSTLLNIIITLLNLIAQHHCLFMLFIFT
jgi:hypothetical protein